MNRFSRWSSVLAITVGLTPAATGQSVSPPEPAALRFDSRFILETVARRMNIVLRPEVPLPAILLESGTRVRRFQDSIAAQWKFRPTAISNAYAIARNEIYLTDDAAFYVRLKRTLDDSLAHEFVHYLQVHYLDQDLASDDAEARAVEIQQWFREVYVRGRYDRGIRMAELSE